MYLENLVRDWDSVSMSMWTVGYNGGRDGFANSLNL